MSAEIHDTASFDEVLEQRFGRRTALKAVLGVGGAVVATTTVGVDAVVAKDNNPYAPGELTYDAVPQSGTDSIVLPAGFTHDVVISWGDPVVPGAPAFDIQNQTGVAQEQQCGFNHDYLAFLPKKWGSDNSKSGLLWINHEYTDSTMMFENHTSSKDQVDVELAAHGGTVVEVVRDDDGPWTYVPTSRYNRRITANTPMTLTGPVAGDSRLQTTADPTGREVLGMLNNCGGGLTPWGTILTCEENFDQYFGKGASIPADDRGAYVKKTLASVAATTGASLRKWENVYPRFDLSLSPREYLRFGWVVEVDPYDPTSKPKKRTALGRFKHEAAAGTTSTGGKFVSYSGDDQVNQFIYKFVTSATISREKGANADLLDSGTLHVARFDADGTGAWLPLTFGTAPLVASSAFTDQADVLIRAREAAKLLGATPMSRPEDIEVNPVTKKVYAVMTGNSAGSVNAANPRANSTSVGVPAGSSIAGQGLGHVVEITEANGDNASLTFAWEIFLLCGQPNQTGSVAVDSTPAAALSTTVADNITYWAGYDESEVSPVARVDNVSFDSRGNVFFSTDGQPSALAGPDPAAPTKLVGWNDCLIGFPTEGAERGHGKTLMTAVDGCEVTGPFFTPDDKTLFVSIQHPGVDQFVWTSPAKAPAAQIGTFAAPGSTWNTTPAIAGRTTGVPRPAALAIRRLNGKEIAYGKPDHGLESASEGLSLSNPVAGSLAGLGGLLAFRYRRVQPEIEVG